MEPWDDRVDIPRLVQEHAAVHPSEWAVIASIAGTVGCTGETLR
jgi:hypothetical protein